MSVLCAEFRAAENIISQLTADSQFMRDINIMDYSLLVGIHNCTEPRHPGGKHCAGIYQVHTFVCSYHVRPVIHSTPVQSQGTLSSGSASEHDRKISAPAPEEKEEEVFQPCLLHLH